MLTMAQIRLRHRDVYIYGVRECSDVKALELRFLLIFLFRQAKICYFMWPFLTVSSQRRLRFTSTSRALQHRIGERQGTWSLIHSLTHSHTRTHIHTHTHARECERHASIFNRSMKFMFVKKKKKKLRRTWNVEF